MTKFRYGNKVKVIDGFWKGYGGFVNGCADDENKFNDVEYEVILELGKKDLRTVYIKERKLMKVK